MQQTRTKEEKQELIQLYKKQPEAKPADDNLNFVEVKATQEIKFSGRQDIRIQKNGIEISIPADAGLTVLERILGAVSAI